MPAQSWYAISIGRSGFQDIFAFGYEGSSQIVRAQLYIDVQERDQNKAIFERLLAEKDTIEAEFGEPLRWERRDDVRMSSVQVTRPGALDEPQESLDELARWGADRLLRFRRVFGPRVKALVLPLPVVPTEPDGVDA